MGGTFPSVILCSTVLLCQGITTSRVSYKEAATQLRLEIINIGNDKLLHKDMQALVDEQSFNNPVLDPATKITEITQNMDDFFRGVFGAVRNVKKKLEELYQNMDAFSADKFVECCNIEEEKLEYSAEFKTKITPNTCYRRAGRSTENYVPTSTILEEVMKDNRGGSPAVKWQYYGTEVGTIAIFPGHKAEDCGNYDPRFRPWYVEAATPTAKDVVILFDRSSSMTNDDKLNLSKAAAKTVLDTLNPNDRVALVQFSTDAYTPVIIDREKCYQDQMAFATPEVKNHLKGFVVNITVDGETKYNSGLQKAFDILKNAENTSSQRRKVILFLTDGGSTTESDDTVKVLLSKLNAEQNNRVLILTYGIGNDFMDGQQLLKDMANMTVFNASAGERQMGRFEHIADTSQLRAKFGSYYNHFAGDFLAHSHPIVTVPYVDFFNLGHIFSVCLSVTNNSSLKGVACIDVTLNDLRQRFDLLEDETIYAFIIDQTGRTLLHPLLPSPGEEVESDPLFVNISVLEPEAHEQKIIDKMKQLEAGELKIKKKIVISRGNAMFDGTDEIEKDALYSWKPIPDTKFSVCLVVVPDHEDIELESMARVSEFHYHLLQLNKPSATLCSHAQQTVTKDYPTYYFSDKAYMDPQLSKADGPYVEYLAGYMTGDIKEDNKFKADVRGSVAVIDAISSKWKIASDHYIQQMYMGTFEGVYVNFPGKELPETFDHTVNSWYRRAKNNVNSFIIYRQSKGITLAKAITQGQSFSQLGNVWGVMGMDLKVTFFQNLLKTHIEHCESSGIRCFLMDNNGYLLFHPDVAPNSTVSHHPIFQYESAIASSLKDKGIFQSKTCTDYAWKEIYHTWKVKDRANPTDSLDSYPYYFFTPIDNTNLYFIMKNETRTSESQTCASCTRNSNLLEPNKCITNHDCYCPCREEANYQYCTNSFINEEGSELYPPCLKTEDSSEDISQQTLEQASNYPVCYPYTCSEMDSDQCGIFDDCDWCYADRSAMTKSCVQEKLCLYEEPSSITGSTGKTIDGDGDANLVSIIVPIVLVILLIVVALGVLFMYKRGITPCNVFSKPKVQADGLYSDIPPDGTFKSRTEIVRQQSDGQFSVSPVGFVNHSYGSSRISVIPGMTNSSEEPQYFTTNSGQPVVLFPVQLNPGAANTSSPEVSYLALGSDLGQANSSLSSSGYASPVPSSAGSQQITGTGNAPPSSIANRSLPNPPQLDLQETHGNDIPPPESHGNSLPPGVNRGPQYVNNPQTGTGDPTLTGAPNPGFLQSYMLSPVSTSQLALRRTGAQNDNNNDSREGNDCNAADITQHSTAQEAPPSEQTLVSHGYLTTGFYM